MTKPSGLEPRELDKDDDLVALDNTAFRVNGKWCAEFVISVFSRRDQAAVDKKVTEFLDYAKIFGINPNSETLKIIQERVKYFVAVPREDVKVRLQGNHGEFSVGPTQENGIMSVVGEIPQTNNERQGDSLVYRVVEPAGYDPTENQTFTTTFSEERGWAIISGMISLDQTNERCRRYNQDL